MNLREDGCKRCARCNEWKDAEQHFFKSKSMGYSGYCRDCNREKTAEWKRNHKEYNKASNARWMREKRSRLREARVAEIERQKEAGSYVKPLNKNVGKRHKPRNPGFPNGVIVDQDIQDSIGHYTWYLHADYVVRSETVAYKRAKTIRLHRQIMDAPDGMQVDHINGNKLDNRRENLRIVTRKTNNQNRSLKGHGSLGHLGVKKTKNGKFNAWGKWNGRDVHLGTFDDILEAAEIARKYREEHYDGYTGRSN